MSRKVAAVKIKAVVEALQALRFRIAGDTTINFSSMRDQVHTLDDAVVDLLVIADRLPK